ncbi:MAG: hypothetical protein K0B87_08435, partial [Candidatus Syntrophosphaera sp.]|nr:hypothetical protein [Candidatus Syntrophosphaera sp.]
GRLGLMFYDDFTWGANAIDPPYHPVCDGGQVMFAELQISFQVANDDPNQPPAANLLLQNHPNPFNPETRIGFELSARAPARLAIYDLKGRLVKVLAEGEFGLGAHGIVWDGTDSDGKAVSSGVYLYCLESGGRREIRRMALLK